MAKKKPNKVAEELGEWLGVGIVVSIMIMMLAAAVRLMIWLLFPHLV